MSFFNSPQQLQPRNPGPCDGFDKHSGQRWIYPNNMPVRGYQKAAVEMALFNNAMIVLPTGFGKTFIAAVVMYNFYRWYPAKKLIFVAPTKPLVAQQIQECKKISGIPSRDCVELTGILSQAKRRELWLTKSVIFATPQVIENDLSSNIVPAESVRCIVIDEAHRAQGGFAYVNIVKYLHEHNRDGFRVLALSATPGSDIQKVQQVMVNLFINEVMFRSETSIDLMQFRNEKSSRAWTVELTGKHKKIVDMYIEMTNPLFRELCRANLVFSGSIDKVAKYSLIKALQGANNNELAGSGAARGRLKFLAASGISLIHSFELLTLYGIRVFYSHISKEMEEGKKSVKSFLAGKVEFEKIMQEIKSMFGEDAVPEIDKVPKADILQSHPKLIVVKDLLIKHFQENADKSETRAIVFTHYRESVFDIVQALKSVSPLIKPAPFVGQQSATGTGMKQKEQIALLKSFKEGTFNVVVATCVAEEGLDIGEVDLIICYDTSSSPISSTQRRGRTGRKRSGNIQTLCTKGFEEKKLQKAGASRRHVEEQLFKKENYMQFKYRNAPRMVPLGLVPVCLEHKVFPVAEDEVEEAEEKKTKVRKRRSRADRDKEKEDETDGSSSIKKKKKQEAQMDEPVGDDDEFDDDDDEGICKFLWPAIARIEQQEQEQERLRQEEQQQHHQEELWQQDELEELQLRL